MNKKVKKKIMTLALAAMLTAVSVMPAKAASEDVIDTSKTASLTIHKYDVILFFLNSVISPCKHLFLYIISLQNLGVRNDTLFFKHLFLYII